VVLGPGAMAGPKSMARHVRGLRQRGIEARAIALPRGRAERAAETFRPLASPSIVAGGHSFGGRAASLAAVEAPFAGLVLFGFPLAGRGEERTRHLPLIPCPVLMLQGETDELSPIDELRRLVARAPRIRLVTFPGAPHNLGASLPAALDEAAAFIRALEAS
ncbi:MAG: dienelactone hydrolase family protein, partial [Candidatus Dormibacteraeota bacterium]|nr:dienelactone hydrolase family protein [Candidatus Dormibacteraeota bacterium]